MRFPPVAQACKALRWPSKRRGPNRNSLMDAFTPPPACSSSPFFLLLLLATSTEVRQYLTCTKSVRPVFCLAFFSPVPLSKPLVHCQRMCSLSFNWPPKKQAAARYVGQPRHVCQLMSVQQKAEEALWSEAAIVTWYYSRIPRDGPMVGPQTMGKNGMRLNMSSFSSLSPPGSHCNHGALAATPKTGPDGSESPCKACGPTESTIWCSPKKPLLRYARNLYGQRGLPR